MVLELPVVKSGTLTGWVCLLVLLFVPALSRAQGPHLPLSIELGPEFLATEFIPAGPDSLKAARVKAAMGLALGRQWLEVDVDYDLRGEAVDAGKGELTQRVQTRTTSQWLDGMLGVGLDFNTDSVLREGGEAYRHLFRPELSARLLNLADVKLRYDYQLEKPSGLAAERARRGYALELKGDFRDGRFAWQGRFRSDDELDHRYVRTRAIEKLELNSRYQLLGDLDVQLRGELRSETRFSEANPQAVSEARYGAGLGWAPSSRYALNLRVDAVEQEAQPQPSVLGSGSISWFPRPGLELKLDYGDGLVEGSSGWMLHTRFDVSG